jgi:hypothetical protein
MKKLRKVRIIATAPSYPISCKVSAIEVSMMAARWKVRSETNRSKISRSRRLAAPQEIPPTVRRKCPDSSEDDNDEGHRIDDDGISRNETQLFLHQPLLRARTRGAYRKSADPCRSGPGYWWRSCSLRSTSSRLKLAAFWRCGYSLNVCRNSPM